MIQQPANWRQYHSNVTEEQRVVHNYVQGVGGLQEMFQSSTLNHSWEKAKTITLKTSINKLLSQHMKDKEECVCFHSEPHFAYKQTYLSRDSHTDIYILFVYTGEKWNVALTLTKENQDFIPGLHIIKGTVKTASQFIACLIIILKILAGRTYVWSFFSVYAFFFFF